MGGEKREGKGGEFSKENVSANDGHGLGSVATANESRAFRRRIRLKTPSVYRANKFLELDLHVVGKLWPTGIETAGVC